MRKVRMAVITVLATALLMAWAFPALAGDMEKVNINTATREQLMTLQGIGEKYADRIITHRDKNGLFKAPQDLLKVKGIGEKTYENNKDRIIVIKDK